MERVLIIGGGLGGLCLAHSLRNAGVEVEVFERDEGPSVRAQGYRLHLDADGAGSLAEALPGELYTVFEATAMHPLPYTTITDTSLSVRRRVAFDEYSGTQHHRASGVASHLNVNRSTLREILLSGLERQVHFGESMATYEVDAEGVTARFTSGRSARGSVLVGADGIRSLVRQKRAPHMRTMDTGLRSIYGRLPIGKARELLPAFSVTDAFTLAADERRLVLGLGPMVFPMAPDKVGVLGTQAALSPQEDYVAFILAGRHERFSAGLRAVSTDDLRREARRLLAAWPAATRSLVDVVEVESLFFVEMFSSIPAHLPAAPRVTLLGDAIHAMSPSLGRGANVALRDSVMLGRQLAAFARGELPLASALAAYETEMTRYGFQVVRQSVETGHRVLGQEPLPGGVEPP